MRTSGLEQLVLKLVGPHVRVSGKRRPRQPTWLALGRATAVLLSPPPHSSGEGLGFPFLVCTCRGVGSFALGGGGPEGQATEQRKQKGTGVREGEGAGARVALVTPAWPGWHQPLLRNTTTSWLLATGVSSGVSGQEEGKGSKWGRAL